MKILFWFIWCLLLTNYSQAQNVGNTTDLLSLPGLSDALAGIIKQTKAIGFVDIQGNLGGGAYLPMRTIHDSANVNYFSIGIAGLTKQTDHWRARGVALLDLTATIHRIEGISSWYQSHITKATIPDIWIGPNIEIPMLGDNVRTWKPKDYIGMAIAIGY